MMPFSFATKCDHSTPVSLGSIQDMPIFLSDEDGVFNTEGLGISFLVLNLTGVSHLGTLPPELQKYSMFDFTEILIKWPDGGFPALTAGFWANIIDYAKEKSFESVLIHCKAGHGRTGTAAAALLITNCQMKPTEAVDYVRDNYCEETVETQTQVNYLGWIAESSSVENDSAKITPSYMVDSTYAQVTPAKKDDEVELVNFDWDEYLL